MSFRMVSRAAAFACLSLVVSACAGAATPDSVGSPSPLSTTTAATSGVDTTPETVPTGPPQTEPAPTTEASPVDRPPPDPGRPIAPDFSLGLADGTTFVLSQEARPVFMVFWAEW